MRIEDEIKQSTFKSESHKAYINLVYTAGRLEQEQAAAFRGYGVTLPQFNVLRILRGQHPLPATVNLLIERMLDKTSNASRIVDKLVSKCLVTRTICPSNRRAVDIRITEAGLDLLRRMDTALDTQKTGLSNLSEDELARLNTILDKIRD